MILQRPLFPTVLTVAVLLISASATAQVRPRFGVPVQTIQGSSVAPLPTTTLGSPVAFDPYATGGAAAVAPSLAPTTIQPVYPQGVPVYPQGVPVQPAPLTSPAYPQYPQYPQTGPPSLYPHGIAAPGHYPSMGGAGPYVKLFNQPGIDYTWLAGSSGRELDINDIDVHVTAAIPGFLWSNYPLYVTPGFRMSLWQGPSGVFPAGYDMPARAYSGYLGFMWNPRLHDMPHLGADLYFEPGVHSDFRAFDTDSFRFRGMGLGVLQLTPSVAIKVGVAHLDRVKVKMLPAGGIVWTPNPQTEFNILFPNPKLRHYWTTVGNTDIWWFLAGEYGGGSWSIEHLTGANDRVDINDIRIGGGIEWIAPGGLTSYIEAAYVFRRELIFASPPAPGVRGFGLKNTFMLRGGFHF